ncbi:MAG: serine/threonine-protein kinase [Deltaproteobacteria bacterium]|nr:serine/threonine-protein kinase [Deltaproteobacteria bacterium]
MDSEHIETGFEGATTVRASAPTNDEIEQKVQELLFAGKGATRIGRFLILEHIGDGGMGRVYAAYDDQLDRKIAIKIVLDDPLLDDDIRLRLRREAQALARLSHPNVVAVYAVGETNAQQLFLAMEFIQGVSLDRWLDTRPDWRQVLDAFVQVGRGLAAAHRSGLVHRDLKPSNMMRSEDGVVKVLDFGLARIDEGNRGAPRPKPSPGVPTNPGDTLTRPGTIMGTPAYMSPEQHRGEVAGKASDQYSFCVSLLEALTGTRPSVAQSPDDLREAIRRRAITIPAVPKTVRDAVLRGLENDPADRWPSMDDLLAALPLRQVHRRRWPWALAGMGGLLAGAIAASHVWPTTPDSCTGAQQHLAGIWDDTRSEQVRAAMLGSGKAFAGDAWTRSRNTLDAYAEAWATMHTEACTTTLRNEQSPQMLELRTACLDRAVEDLGMVVDLLAQPDEGEVVRRAHEVTAGLRPLAQCADLEALPSAPAPPAPGERAAVEQARRAVTRARHLRRAGRPESGRDAIDRARRTLESTDYPLAMMELDLEDAAVLGALGEFEASEVVLTRAMGLATELERPIEMAVAARRLMHLLGVDQHRRSEALHYWPLVEGGFDGQPRQLARARRVLALILRGEGQPATAEQELRTALAVLERQDALESLLVADLRASLAATLVDLRRHSDAEVQIRAAASLRERLLGPHHPQVAESRAAVAGLLRTQGKDDEAEAESTAALTILAEALGATHPEVVALSDRLAREAE